MSSTHVCRCPAAYHFSLLQERNVRCFLSIIWPQASNNVIGQIPLVQHSYKGSRCLIGRLADYHYLCRLAEVEI